MKVLPKGFYTRDPAMVARDLLGKALVRKTGAKRLMGEIVEVEAYYSRGRFVSK